MSKKMKIFAIIGSTEQIVDEREVPKQPDGYIEMKEPRPDNNYVAAKGGIWVRVGDDLAH